MPALFSGMALIAEQKACYNIFLTATGLRSVLDSRSKLCLTGIALEVRQGVQSEKMTTLPRKTPVQ